MHVCVKGPILWSQSTNAQNTSIETKSKSMVLLRVGELIVNAYEAKKIFWNYINGHSPASCGYSENNLILYFRIELHNISQ